MLTNANVHTCHRGATLLVSSRPRTRSHCSAALPSASACSAIIGSAPLIPCQAPVAHWGGAERNCRGRRFVTRSFGAQQHDGDSDAKVSWIDDYVEVKVDSVRVAAGTSVVCLRICQEGGMILPLHIGEAESSALLKEINKQKGARPLTHDLAKHLMQALGVRVTKIRITEVVNSTYYSRIHIARNGSTEEIELDGRPSDAINLAVRFDAPMYMHKSIADKATSSAALPVDKVQGGESHADIVRSVRELLANFEDPTTLLYLQKDMAVQEERYNDAHAFQQQVEELMTHSLPLRLMVAMEAALADGRYEEAARVRDEYRQLLLSATTTKAKAKAWLLGF